MYALLSHVQLLEGEGSIPSWGGEFSPLMCDTDFPTGCWGFLRVLRFVPTPLSEVKVHFKTKKLFWSNITLVGTDDVNIKH